MVITNIIKASLFRGGDGTPFLKVDFETDGLPPLLTRFDSTPVGETGRTYRQKWGAKLAALLNRPEDGPVTNRDLKALSGKEVAIILSDDGKWVNHVGPVPEENLDEEF